ncbi:MAG TPA: glycoside hydrolase family 16 protein [Anaerohalosphaeraceae bacterium]|nr:glycoside hydrolase family 16 protein [Anaerohalosphaeraceae bacterium]
MLRTASIIWFLTFASFLYGQNLLVNGNFESGLVKGHFANGYPDNWQGWGTNGWHHSDVGYRKDNYGIAIWDNDTGLSQSVPVTAGMQLQVSGEMIYHTTEVLVNKRALIKIEFWNGPAPSGTKISETVVGTLMPSHTAGVWYTFAQTLTVPASANLARILCYTVSTGSPSTGKAYWDNLSIEDGQVINDPDYNLDQIINLLDFAPLASAWLNESASYNLSSQNQLTLEDLDVFCSRWLDTPPQYPGYRFVWSDEFEGPSIDTANWTWEIGAGGWGNNELQYYTDHPDNSYIENGCLVIAARKNHLGKEYTSARLKTQNKRSFCKGRMEARIKLPAGGKGIWPAFWMLGNTISTIGWPGCGEIDIMEAVNFLSRIYGTLHYGSSNPYIHDSNGGSYSPAQSPTQDFHIYAIEWDTNQIRWYYDSINYYTTSNWWSSDPYPAPFNQPFFFIVNIAVGGNWPGYPDSTTPFPQLMYIDYIRVYEKIN